MRTITIPGALPPKGHYSPAIEDGGRLYISGQLPVDPFTGERCAGSVREQAGLALQNLGRLLEAAGAARSDVVKMTVYISDISLWDEVNVVYSEFFGEHRPARSVVPTGPLHYGFMVELEGIAHLK